MSYSAETYSSETYATDEEPIKPRAGMPWLFEWYFEKAKALEEHWPREPLVIEHELEVEHEIRVIKAAVFIASGQIAVVKRDALITEHNLDVVSPLIKIGNKTIILRDHGIETSDIEQIMDIMDIADIVDITDEEG